MACNVPLVVTNDNELLCSLLPEEVIKVDPHPEAIKKGFLEAMEKEVKTRDYLLDKGYTHYDYADKILEVLNG